jgi:tRNA (mo5U34)-methyltransferase
LLVSAEAARDFLAKADFVWHQRFELAPGVSTPGDRDIEFVLEAAELPDDLTGKSVLDVGTANGGAAFRAEQRGASRVVAVDIYPPTWFGFAALRDFLGSRVEYVQGTVYELQAVLGGEKFDFVVFFGVLYHLRHPLLGLDEVRAVLSETGTASIETAVCDDEVGELSPHPMARFYRRDELAGDTSNWFAPTVACLEDWCASAGLLPRRTHVWGAGQTKRALVIAGRSAGEPEFLQLSSEVPLEARPAGDVSR